MKSTTSKLLRCLLTFGGLALAASNAAAAVADFDNLAPTTPYTGPGGGAYWNGADGSGGFRSGGVHFLNTYNSGWNSWDGWAYSNTTDTITAGYENQYSAFAGGAHSGANYGVFFAPWSQTPTVTAPAPCAFEGMYVTNTTYAALSMLNGDATAKKFGGESGDDPDWFLLSIVGKDADGGTTGTVDFYLADYRFENNALDYVLDGWAYVDLTPLGDNVKSLEFALTSSDNGGYGMNTPAYFAMDDLKTSAVPEPSTLALLCGVGVAAAMVLRKRRFSLERAAVGTKECG
jgi:hypothetical protein